MSRRLDGRVAWITGGARGMGRAIAERFAAEGATVVISDIDRQVSGVPYATAGSSDLIDALESIHRAGGDGLALVADVRSQSQLDDAARRILDEYGQIDILVVSHGVVSYGRPWELSDDDWDTQIDINLSGVWRAVRAVMPSMMKSLNGCIIINASMSSREATPNMTHYVAAKHGVAGLSKGLALELGPSNIRVNSVLTGSVNTPMANNPVTLERLFGRADADAEEFLDATRHWSALRGRASLPPSAVADGVLWLASDEAQHVTGIELVIDAGHSILPGYNLDPVKDAS